MCVCVCVCESERVCVHVQCSVCDASVLFICVYSLCQRQCVGMSVLACETVVCGNECVKVVEYL